MSNIIISKRELFGRKDVNIEIPDDVFPSQEEINDIDKNTGNNCQHGWYKSCSSSNKNDDDDDDDDIHLHYRYWFPPPPPTTSTSNSTSNSTSTSNSNSGDDDKNGNEEAATSTSTSTSTSTATSTPPDIKGIVIYTHGVHSQSGHASRLDDRPLDIALIVDTFTQKGMAVYARDQYGHGFSEGTRFYIPSWEDNRNDLIEFIKLISNLNSKQIPLFIAGESYGGCLTILASKYFQDYPNEKPINYDSCLLIAPAIEGELPPFPILQLLRYVLAPIAPKWIPFFMPNTVSPNKIWKDQKILDYYTSPQKLNMKLDAIGKPFRLGTAVQLLQALEECRSNCISNYNQAFCIVHGSNDVAVPVSGSQLLYDNCITLENDKELHIIDGSYHGILAEPEAEIAMKYIIDYVDKRMNKFNNSPK